jgi:hypothetical protein
MNMKSQIAVIALTLAIMCFASLHAQQAPIPIMKVEPALAQQAEAQKQLGLSPFEGLITEKPVEEGAKK